jgi:hypothetical protein
MAMATREEAFLKRAEAFVDRTWTFLPTTVSFSNRDLAHEFVNLDTMFHCNIFLWVDNFHSGAPRRGSFVTLILPDAQPIYSSLCATFLYQNHIQFAQWSRPCPQIPESTFGRFFFFLCWIPASPVLIRRHVVTPQTIFPCFDGTVC